MAKTRLLQAACTAALLAAAPAFAQTNAPGSSNMGVGTSPTYPAARDTMPNGNMAPADRMGSTRGSMDDMNAHGAMDDHATHRGAMSRESRAMRGSDSSQSAAVDQLNDQSYRAARSGQAFNGSMSDSTSGTMGSPGGSGTMNDMHGGSMSRDGTMGNGSMSRDGSMGNGSMSRDGSMGGGKM